MFDGTKGHKHPFDLNAKINGKFRVDCDNFVFFSLFENYDLCVFVCMC